MLSSFYFLLFMDFSNSYIEQQRTRLDEPTKTILTCKSRNSLALGLAKFPAPLDIDDDDK